MRPELEVADIFRDFGPAYRQAHGDHLDGTTRRVMAAIEACRTATLGGHVEQCTECGFVRYAYNSCRDRHCPKCQGLARAEWLEARQADLLPVPYFHVVFTVPAAVANLAFFNKEVVYGILFHASAEALRTVGADDRYLGAELGAIALLHTWGQTLHHHPHVHCIVPGGGISPDQTRWVPCLPGFFLPVRVLSRCFRDLFVQQLRTAFTDGELRFPGALADLADPAAFAAQLDALTGIDWVVYCQAAVRRTRAGARLSRPLHPPRRHRQQPAGRACRRPGELHLEGLPARRQDQGDDAGGRRVYPPFPPAQLAGRLPPHPPHRLPGQLPSRRETRALP